MEMLEGSQYLMQCMAKQDASGRMYGEGGS